MPLQIDWFMTDTDCMIEKNLFIYTELTKSMALQYPMDTSLSKNKK